MNQDTGEVGGSADSDELSTSVQWREFVSPLADGMGRFGVDDAALFAYVASRVPPDDELPSFLARCDADEMLLVCACQNHSRGALADFEARYLHEVDVGARRVKASPQEIEEVRQLVRDQLYVRDASGAMKLATMTGRGDLRALLRVIGLRTTISLRRKTRVYEPLDSHFELIGDNRSPELVALKAEHRHLLRVALAHAVDSLAPRDRVILRLHEQERVTLDKLAQMHKVNRATISRWLLRAREQIFRETRKYVTSEGGVSWDDFDSFIDVVRSRFDLSVFSLLGPNSSQT